MAGERNDVRFRPAEAALWAFAAECESGRRAEAAQTLASVPKAGWTEIERHVGEFLVGRMTEAQLESRAGDRSGTMFLPWLAIGLQRKMSGDGAEAKRRLEVAVKMYSAEEMNFEAVRRMLRGL